MSCRASDYITREGYQKLRLELGQRWEQRGEVVKHLSAAADEGDRSENAEYIYRKKEIREIDRRIRYLQRKLPVLEVVYKRALPSEKVFFGAWVSVLADDGMKSRYGIVGVDETDVRKIWISVVSPMARALLGRRIGDKVGVKTPNGTVTFHIIDVVY